MSSRACATGNPSFSPISRFFHKVEWIEVNVVQDVQEVCIACDPYLFGPSLEKYAASLVLLVEIHCIPYIQFAQKEGQASLAPFGKEEVIVITHEAPPMDIYNSIPYPSSINIGRSYLPIFGEFGGRRHIVEFIEIVDKAHSVGIVDEKFALFNAAIKCMVELHESSISGDTISRRRVVHRTAGSHEMLKK